MNTTDKILEALDVLQTGIGLIEIGAGLAGLGGSGALEFITVGGGLGCGYTCSCRISCVDC